MQLPWPNLSLVVLLTLVISPSALAMYDICYFQNKTERCAVGNFDPPIIELPRNICFVDSCPTNSTCLLCSDCSVANWVTYAHYKGRLYEPSHVLAKTFPNQTGTDAAFDCTRIVDYRQRRSSRATCSCPETQPCSGDSEFCQKFTCDSRSTCFCITRPLTVGSYLQVTSDFGFDNPLLVSFKACIYQEPPTLKPSRKLLSIDTAEFRNGFAEISFHDPVFTFNTSGTFIARKDGLEIIHSITDDSRQFILPLSFRYTEGSLFFTFVTPNGNILTGTVHVPSSTHCSRIGCTFCMEMLSNLSCLPPAFQYLVYGFFICTTGLVLIYIRSACAAIYAMLRSIIWILYGIFRIFRTCFRLSLRTGLDWHIYSSSFDSDI